MRNPFKQPLNDGDIAVLIMVAFVIAGFIFYYSLYK